MIPSADWSYPTAIRFGPGRCRELPDTCRECGIKNPLLVTDAVLAKLPLMCTLRDNLRAAGLSVGFFDAVHANPDDRDLAAGIDAFKTGAHDGVIAIGGGSSLDIGKLIALMADQTISVWDLEDIGDHWRRADATAIKPIIAVPTTAGTGSEVGRAGVLTHSRTRVKKIIFHPNIMPARVICDPELTLDLPAAITAGTGMDAFAHCLEAYCSPHYHPFSQGIAVEGMRLVKKSLRRAYRCGHDLAARADMMAAAAMGATAFQKGLGAIHALSHPIGARYHTHHGTTNAVVMQPVLRFNRAVIEARIDRLAGYLDIEGGFDGFDNFVGALNAELGIPANLRELGVPGAALDDLDALVGEVLGDPSCGGNPILMTIDNTRALLRGCF